MALTPTVPSQNLGCCYLGYWGHRGYTQVSPWEICEKFLHFPERGSSGRLFLHVSYEEEG